MNATASPATIAHLQLGAITRRSDYTMQKAGTIKLGKDRFKVKLQRFYADGSLVTWFHGASGAVYMLQPVSKAESTGVFRLRSLVTGTPRLKADGSEFQVLIFGNVVEAL